MFFVAKILRQFLEDERSVLLLEIPCIKPRLGFAPISEDTALHEPGFFLWPSKFNTSKRSQVPCPRIQKQCCTPTVSKEYGQRYCKC